jgi:hypothetical protein
MVEILAYAPTAFYYCTHCEVAWREMGTGSNIHKEQLETSLPEDLQEDYRAVSDWVREQFRLHGEHLLVRVIDAASIEGVYKSIKYGAHRYPAIILEGGTKFQGIPMLETAGRQIAERLQERLASL